MKKIFNSFVVVAMIAAAATTSSCTKTCDAGYEGSDCKTEVRAKFTGTLNTTYTAVEDGSNSAATTYPITITKSTTDVQKVLIGNLWNSFNNSVIATVEGDNFTIATQIPDNDGFSVSGSGTISGNVITVTYTVTDGTVTPPTTDVITNGKWTKQ